MIGKITKGSRTGSIGAYLHGAGRSNEHTYTRGGQTHSGGIVIGSNLPQVIGDTDSKRWAAELRKPLCLREREVRQPIWQVSLSLPPQERLGTRQWADAAQTFVEQLGLENHAWVAVHHGSSAGGNDHIHIVVNRVDYAGKLWAAKHDYRQVQRVCTSLERQYGLSHAPRTRSEQSKARVPQRDVYEAQQNRAEKRQQVQRAVKLARLSSPIPATEAVKPRTLQERLAAEQERLRTVKAARPRIDPPTMGKGIGR